MRALRRFTVVMTNNIEHSVQAHFLTQINSVTDIRFFVKPHWYSRRRCVGTFDWRYTLGVKSDAPIMSDPDWLKEAKVKL